MSKSPFYFSRPRFLAIIGILLLILIVVISRLLYLEYERGFLLSKASQESVHYLTIPATRGALLDRNGIPMAVSAPIVNVVFDPYLMLQYPESWRALAHNAALGMDYDSIKSLINSHPKSQFMYVKKGISPEDAKTIAALHVPGIYLEQVNQSFYPSGISAAQLVGFTNNNNVGQDGLELAYNSILQSHNGKEEVIENALGQILSIVDVNKQAQDGKDLDLSMDSRIQFIAYNALKRGVETTHADSGSAVVLDPHTGEILAAVSYPSFNPNDVNDRKGPRIRNRAITDSFEPGSVAKPFTIAVALESGRYTPDTLIDTSPGYYFFQGHKIRDDDNNGVVTVTGVLQKSSNVGVSKIALSLPHQDVYNMLVNAGFNAPPTGGIFPGETRGIMHPLANLSDFEYATMTFGYAFSISTLQLARAYGVLANEGVICPATFLKLDQAPPTCTRIMKAETAKQILAMLATVTQAGGTAILANIPGFSVAGKTGTSHQAAPHGYYANRYNSQFVGIVPIDNPQLVIAIHIDNPKGYQYSFGGHSAAPIFAEIAINSLRVMGVGFTQNQINQSVFHAQQALTRAISH